jgi:hypothetical protein
MHCARHHIEENRPECAVSHLIPGRMQV